MIVLQIAESVISRARGFFGMAFLVCAGISLVLLIGELIWYRVKKKRGSAQ